VNRERWFEMAESFSAVTSQHAPGETLCSRCRDLLSVTDVGISLVTATNVGPLCASGDRAQALEDAQFTLGEGPSCEAVSSGSAVVEENVTSARPARWPALASLARDAGVEGIFAFPIQIGAARLGVLTCYEKEAGAWPTDRYADALVACDVLSHVILAIQAKAPSGDLAEALRDAGSYRAEVHQASGMLSVQGTISVSEALVRLRSFAYASQRPISDLASSIIARKLRLVRSDSLGLNWSED
jgi:hypothetical protein